MSSFWSISPRVSSNFNLWLCCYSARNIDKSPFRVSPAIFLSLFSIQSLLSLTAKTTFWMVNGREFGSRPSRDFFTHRYSDEHSVSFITRANAIDISKAFEKVLCSELLHWIFIYVLWMNIYQWRYFSLAEQPVRTVL